MVLFTKKRTTVGGDFRKDSVGLSFEIEEHVGL